MCQELLSSVTSPMKEAKNEAKEVCNSGRRGAAFFGTRKNEAATPVQATLELRRTKPSHLKAAVPTTNERPARGIVGPAPGSLIVIIRIPNDGKPRENLEKLD